jgi:hypothetical protein
MVIKRETWRGLYQNRLLTNENMLSSKPHVLALMKLSSANQFSTIGF